MNPVIEAILKRRSVRSYESRPIPKDILEKLIECANEAPSGMNSQPWRFIVIEDEEMKKKLLRAALPNVKKFAESAKAANPERYEMIKKRFEELKDPIYYSAPAIIFVIGSGPFADLSCPLACENMMLAAYSFGLGSCWVGFGSMVTDNAEAVRALELKEGEKIFGPILLGYPKGETPRPPKKEAVVKWI
jgi:nitroreductase